MAEVTAIEQTDEIIVEAVQVPTTMLAGSHDDLMGLGYWVSGEGEDWIEYDSEGGWVLVDRNTRQVRDFG